MGVVDLMFALPCLSTSLPSCWDMSIWLCSNTSAIYVGHKGHVNMHYVTQLNLVFRVDIDFQRFNAYHNHNSLWISLWLSQKFNFKRCMANMVCFCRQLKVDNDNKGYVYSRIVRVSTTALLHLFSSIATVECSRYYGILNFIRHVNRWKWHNCCNLRAPVPVNG